MNKNSKQLIAIKTRLNLHNENIFRRNTYCELFAKSEVIKKFVLCIDIFKIYVIIILGTIINR